MTPLGSPSTSARGERRSWRSAPRPQDLLCRCRPLRSNTTMAAATVARVRRASKATSKCRPRGPLFGPSNRVNSILRLKVCEQLRDAGAHLPSHLPRMPQLPLAKPGVDDGQVGGSDAAPAVALNAVDCQGHRARPAVGPSRGSAVHAPVHPRSCQVGAARSSVQPCRQTTWTQLGARHEASGLRDRASYSQLTGVRRLGVVATRVFARISSVRSHPKAGRNQSKKR
jgi:hypothetical protein